MLVQLRRQLKKEIKELNDRVMSFKLGKSFESWEDIEESMNTLKFRIENYKKLQKSMNFRELKVNTSNKIDTMSIQKIRNTKEVLRDVEATLEVKKEWNKIVNEELRTN